MFNLKLINMEHFDHRQLVSWLEQKGWSLSYSMDDRHYWNAVWESPQIQYVLEIPVWPYTKNTFLTGKLRGRAVHKSSGEVWDAPFLEFQMEAEQYRIYNDIRMWISYLISQDENLAGSN
jgi:hypothetical protein